MTTVSAATPRSKPPGRRRFSWQRLAKWLVSAAVTAAVVGLLLFLAGVMHSKVPSQRRTVAPAQMRGGRIVEVRQVRRPRFESAVGTIRPIHEVSIASKLLARVVEASVRAGQPVTQGDVLIRLDDADLQARLRQADAAAVSTKATLQQAEADANRASRLFQRQAMSQQEYEKAQTAAKAAAAEVERTQQAVREAQVMLDHATLKSPIDGVVVDKQVESGDTVSPGQILVTLYNPEQMQMVASVRESLATKLEVGQKLPARLESLGFDCEATVSEIVPEAQTASRSFAVKVVGPCPPGAYSGMFARLYLPLGEEDVVVIPQAAVLQVGQLTMVDVVDGDRAQRRSIQTGREFGDDVEVLSGLQPGERVLVAGGESAGAGQDGP